ncbi:MAG TPA: SCO family protein [Chitinophagaceae bacterium]|nr:SCO family protein [Chitinophagaceae bacterium]HNA90615.1 SCO family protein [Chitinophagaceae bacterium]HNA96458.1 SCO family protein [Chitinophagaceae bacterium]HNJ54810.1 SCO family protein [Chitinophagaceae bacterium]HNK59796.1 SCO family protein [Chitinophagaceae bacterium]
MNKKALYGILLALLLPLISFLIFRKETNSALVMPGHYKWDTVVEKVNKGKKTNDTIWHKLADISLQNQLGDTITWDSLKGKIVIADLFFTHCPTICPTMTKNMKRMAESINNGQKVGDRSNKLVHFLSFSVDPERDTIEQLKRWTDRFQINPENWWLLTGNKKEIYDFAIKEMMIFAEDGKGVDTSFIHSDRFVLIDSSRHLRGFYNGMDSSSLAQLSRDLVLLTMERSPNEKSGFRDKMLIMAIAFLSTIFGAGLVMYLIKRKK